MKYYTNRLKAHITPDLTPEAAEELAAEIAGLMITERAKLAALDAEIKAVQERHSTAIERVRDQIKARFPLLQAWAESNRDKFFGKRKSLAYLHSEIGFRIGQPKLSLLKGWSWKSVLENLKSWNPDFVRTKEEVDRQALLADRKRLEAEELLPEIGVRITQTESFYLDPKATEPSETSSVSSVPSVASVSKQAA